MSHWLAEIWIQIRDIYVSFTFIFVSSGESCLLVSWCTDGRRGMMGSNENHDRSRRPGAENWGWSHSSDTQWPYDWKVGATVCGLHRARGDKEHEFLGWASKLRLTVRQWFDLKTTRIVCQWFELKTTVTDSPSLSLKSVATISPGLTSKSVVESFSVWVSKPVAMVYWFGHQNHGDDFLVWASKPSKLRFVGCATKPTGGWK
jgi:hypothetical protein